MTHHQRAFTLIELLVVMTLLSILLMIAAPSFRDFQRSSTLSSQTNTLVAALHAAKNEAIKRNVPSLLEPKGNGWNDGWRVFADSDFDGTYTEGTDHLVVESDPITTTLKFGGGDIANKDDSPPPYVRFNGSGYPASKSNGFGNLSLSIQFSDVSGEEQARNSRVIVISRTGRIRTCQPTSAVDSKCKDD